MPRSPSRPSGAPCFALAQAHLRFCALIGTCVPFCGVRSWMFDRVHERGDRVDETLDDHGKECAGRSVRLDVKLRFTLYHWRSADRIRTSRTVTKLLEHRGAEERLRGPDEGGGLGPQPCHRAISPISLVGVSSYARRWVCSADYSLRFGSVMIHTVAAAASTPAIIPPR